MGLYRQLYEKDIWPHIEARLLSQGQVHGAEVRDMFLQLAQGRFAVDDHAEKFLTELVEEKVLAHSPLACPTQSQAAFIGLQYNTKSYRDAGWVPGLREHYWYWRC